MIWSYSNSRTFSQCPRQWFFRTRYAHHASRDLNRKEAFILSHLQSVYAWRGKVVDETISSWLVPRLLRRQAVSQDALTGFARGLFNRQWEFARMKKYRDLGAAISKIGNQYCALYPLEYGGVIEQSELAALWEDIEHSLSNLMRMSNLIAAIQRAHFALIQRTFSFQLDGITVRAVPDLVLMYRDAPPAIVDWKVKAQPLQDFRRQLSIYAIAVAQTKPHKDFPLDVIKGVPQDTRLLEVQLLSGRYRTHKLTEEDISDTEGFIAQSSEEMLLALGSDEASNEPQDFEPTAYPDTCGRCNFKRICWEPLHA